MNLKQKIKNIWEREYFPLFAVIVCCAIVEIVLTLVLRPFLSDFGRIIIVSVLILSEILVLKIWYHIKFYLKMFLISFVFIIFLLFGLTFFTYLSYTEICIYPASFPIIFSLAFSLKMRQKIKFFQMYQYLHELEQSEVSV